MKVLMAKSFDSGNIDFDKMMGLYKTNPKAFETYRKQLIEDVINKIEDPECRQRMKGFQFRIDNKLNKYKNPLMRFEEMQRLFWLQFYKLKKVLHNPSDFVQKQTNLAPVVSINKTIGK